MRRIVTLLSHTAMTMLLTATVFLTACNVHEWPEIEYGEVPFVLNLDYETAMPLYKEITYTRGAAISREQPVNSEVRYIVNVYRAGESRSASRAASRSYVFTKPYDGEFDRSVTIELGEGAWDIYVWTDYTDYGTEADKYYTTTDFGNITYRDRDHYEGSNDCKEAFRGMTTVKVTHPYRYMEDEPLPAYEATVDMMRPMGRYEFISTDVEAFLSRVSASRTRSGELQPEGSSDDANTVDISEFRVVFRYNAFMPCAFNMFTDKPADSWTGMSYESSMAMSDDGMLLGFDYVLVNGSETLMNINVEVYDRDGSLLSVTRAIEVPIVRNHLTIVKGEFLTSAASGGVSINPGYDDDFNIEIH